MVALGRDQPSCYRDGIAQRGGQRRRLDASGRRDKYRDGLRNARLWRALPARGRQGASLQLHAFCAQSRQARCSEGRASFACRFHGECELDRQGDADRKIRTIEVTASCDHSHLPSIPAAWRPSPTARVTAASAGVHMRRSHSMPFGAAIVPRGVRFRLWAPAARRVEVGVGAATDDLAWHDMRGDPDGWYERVVEGARAGARYYFRIDDATHVPDPASRCNPDDVHGASQVVDPLAYDWHDVNWRGRLWHEAVLYELHVGAFTAAGTFDGVADRLDYLADLGVTAIELMPIADFPGRRNWGYDGTLLFAPDATYGPPDTLKALIDAAHARDLMVMLDVVYNHFGPEGNYLHLYAPDFFTERHVTPWGAGLNFDGERSRVVRDFFVHNALYWLEEFHIDGLRLDAVHAIADDSTPDILTELASAVREGIGRERAIHLVLENDRNEARRLVRDGDGRPRYYTAQWNDDLHHALHTAVTGERQGYYD